MSNVPVRTARQFCAALEAGIPLPLHFACSRVLTPRTLRAVHRLGLAAAITVLGCEALQSAAADGDTRTISMHQIHTGEDITITYKREGRYDPEALKKINWFLRDWRKEQSTTMDPHLLDVVWEVYRETNAKAPIQVVCGYRSPDTNAMLRNRSRASGVAQFSQHTLGKAMDFFIPAVPLEQQRIAGLRLQRGGVGYYPTSGSPFIHLDVGHVRHWPRMTHDQLARVFPDGRTVHIPSDGRPLAHYALALADIEKRGSSTPSVLSLDAARSAGVATASAGGGNVLAKLFNFGKDEDDDADSAPAARDKAPNVSVAAVTKSAPVAKPVVFAAVPLPPPRPGAVRIAAAAPSPRIKLSPAARVADARIPNAKFEVASLQDNERPAMAALTANDIVASRGYWGPSDRGVDSAKVAPRRPIQTASADPAMTGLWPQRGAAGLPNAALAYAAATPADHAAAQSLPMGASPLRSAPTVLRTSANSTIAIKQDAMVRSTGALPRATASAIPRGQAGDRYDSPWLRAMIIAPNMTSSMTPSALGDTDPRSLTVLMQKPVRSALMTFSNDPNSGLSSEQFGGTAVVFMSTVTFNNRTALLQ